MRHLFVAAAVAAASCGGTGPAQNPQSTAPQQFVVAVSTSGNGVVRGMNADCRGACTQRFDSGAKLVLHAAPDAGATFSGWSGVCSGTGDCALTVSADLSVSATFATPAPPPPVPRHSLTVLVDGHGSVRSLPGGIDCGATCATTFDEGTAVTLTATPDAGYTFGAWSGACNGAGTCALPMGADTTVHARFDLIPPPPPPKMVSLNITVTGAGSVTGSGINCSGSCSTQVAQGSAIVLTANASTGSRFMGFGGACSGQSCSFTARADASVSARFEQEVLTLAPSDGTNVNVLAINSTQVFFERYGSGIYGIWSVPKAGGAETFISALCCVSSMVADDDFVYWADWGSINRVPAAGGATQRLFNSNDIGALVLDGTTLYWTVQFNNNWYATGGVYSGSTAGGTARLLASGVHAHGLAVDSQYVYWTDKDGTGPINRVPKAGGTATNIINCGTCYPVAVKVDFDNIYYRNVDGDIWMQPKAGGNFFKINTGNAANSNVSSQDLEINAKVVYFSWTEYNTSSGNAHGLFKANADGTSWAAIETASDSTWSGPKVDDNYIFYLHAGALYRRLK